MKFVVVWTTAVLSSPVSNSCAFRQNVSTAVFDDCSLMLVGLGESLEGVVGLFAVP